MHTACPLNLLPHELLLYQLTFFPDLSTHLAFSTTCRRVRNLYDQNLWCRIALSSGLGRPLDIDLSWRQVCLTSVVHGKVCSLPDCSEANLSRGRHPGLLALPCELLCSSQSVRARAIDLQLSPVFEGLTGDIEDLFSASIPCNIQPRSWWPTHFLQNTRRSDVDFLTSIATPSLHAPEQKVTKLAHHFPASCALATVPAVDCLELDIGNESIHVRNRDGVCVWDVVSALAKRLLEVAPATATAADKPPMRIHQVIAQEWQQHIILRASMHGPGSVTAHLDISEEILEDHVDSAAQ